MELRRASPPPPPPGPAPDWYPDPSGVGEYRFWDGSGWTHGVVIGGQVTERPMPWPPLAGTSGPVVAAEPDERVPLPGRASLYALAGFLAGLVAGVAMALGAAALDLPDVAVLLANLAGLWSGLFGACWLASRRHGTGDLRRDYGLRIGSAEVRRGLLMSVAARVAGAVAVAPLVLISERVVGGNSAVYGEVDTSPATFAVFALVVVLGAPLVEELFFRGLLLRSLSSVMSAGAALGTQAALFGVAHLSPLLGLANLSVFAVIGAAGLVFGITARDRGLGTSVVAHAAFNLVSVAFLAVASFT